IWPDTRCSEFGLMYSLLSWMLPSLTVGILKLGIADGCFVGYCFAHAVRISHQIREHLRRNRRLHDSCLVSLYRNDQDVKFFVRIANVNKSLLLLFGRERLYQR